ncbi:class I SAM-dependent methyltransferase [Actinomadura scrupuli]|uniref:class I SAM-dependent methyltransferase n=1 Tax=Actinomadura scrupuli TaxID=559629 RepID=UPI003D953B50
MKFFADRAATWEEKFPDDGPAFAAAIAELAPAPGQTVLDAGSGTGRAVPLLRQAVGAAGHVIAVDLTPEMVRVAAGKGRGAQAALLLADTLRLPLRTGCVDATLAAGLLSHLPDPAAALAELARVTRRGGGLAMFHPVGRAALAARRGHDLRADDIRAEPNLRPALERTGWSLTRYDDGPDRYLALAIRNGD